MTYAVLQDLVEHFGETELVLLSNDDPNATTPDPAVAAKALEKADKKINSYIADRFPLPLARVPDQLVDLACDLARYELATRNGNSRPTDVIKDARDEAMKLLDAISKGRLSLGLDASGQPVLAGGVTRSVPPDRVFSKETLSDYMPMDCRRPRWPGGN